MKPVEQHIKNLLYRHECVVVPGFGAFITQRKPAQIHESTHAFYPPKKTLSFNGQLVKNDGLLAKHIAEVEKVPYEKAMEKIQLFVEQITTVLSEEKEVNLHQIGAFKKEKEGNLRFFSQGHNYLLDAFGLELFTSQKIDREVYKPARPAGGKEAEKIEAKTGLVFTHEKKTGTTHKYLKYAAVGLLALGLSGFLGLNWYTDQVKTHNLAAEEKAESQLDKKIQKAVFSISEPLPEITFTVDVQAGNYHIVAGAFRVKANAEKKTRLLIEKGFHARQIGKNKYGLHQVVYSSHTNRLEALRALRKIRRTDNENAWLLVQEL